MAEVYDNWERLVAATLKREEFRQLALASSRETSFSSSASARFNSPFNFKIKSAFSHEPDVHSHVVKVILLADRVAKVSESTSSFRQECLEIKSKAEKIGSLLRQVARASHELYDRPAHRVMGATKSVLKKAISLVLKCQGLKRVFVRVTSASFQDMSSQIQQCIGNIYWLLRDDGYRGIPPIAADEPILCNIWELIAILHTGSVEGQGDALASLVSLAHESDTYKTLIMEEGRIEPFLKILQREGTVEVQENAVRLVTLLRRKEKGPMFIDYDIWLAFERILAEGPLIRLQGTVAWAVSELAEIIYDYDDYKLVYMLGHLAFKTLPRDFLTSVTRDESGTSLFGLNNRRIEMEDLDYIKTMAAKGLWRLAAASALSCRRIAQSKALTCLAFFLDRGPKEAKYNSAMALMEISTVAEDDTELGRNAFNSKVFTCNAVVESLFRIIDADELEILVPCVKIIGNLAGTFEATETRMISLLVRLLEKREAGVSREACIALIKFAHPDDNCLNLNRLEAIVNAGGVKLLVQLVCFGEEMLQPSALKLLCCIGFCMPGNGALAEAKVLSVLKWASKQSGLIRVANAAWLLSGAIEHLKMFYSN